MLHGGEEFLAGQVDKFDAALLAALERGLDASAGHPETPANPRHVPGRLPEPSRAGSRSRGKTPPEPSRAGSRSRGKTPPRAEPPGNPARNPLLARAPAKPGTSPIGERCNKMPPMPFPRELPDARPMPPR